MAQKEKHKLVGEGDDFVESWYHGFDAPMSSIEDRILEAESFDLLPIEWDKVLRGLTGVDRLKESEIIIDYSTETHIFFENIPGAYVEYEKWGGHSPGLSGVYVEVYVLNSNLKSILRKMSCISQRLDRYWERSGNAKIVRGEEEKSRKAMTIELQQKVAVKKEKGTQEKLKFQKAYNRIVEKVIAFLQQDDISNFLELGPILVTSSGQIYVIKSIGSRYPSYKGGSWALAIRELQARGYSIEHVVERYPQNNIRYFSGGGGLRMGWSQEASILSGGDLKSTEIINRLRREYIDWLKNSHS